MAEARIPAAGGFLLMVLACAALIAGTHALTRDRIEENRARRFQQTLTELAGSAGAAARARWTDDTAALCNGRVLLRGSAAGYGGQIRWLAAATSPAPRTTPRLVAVRITAHQETPGIADFLQRPDSGWLSGLAGAGANELAGADGVSGATITSRALQRSLAAALQRPAVADPECPS